MCFSCPDRGYRRVHEEMVDRGIDCTSGRVRCFMKMMGLRGLQKRRYKSATSDGGAQVKGPNLLKERPLPTGLNQVWAGDITYIRSAKGWLYFAVVIDLYSRRIVGWALHQTMKVGMAMEAFSRAVKTRTPGPNLIFHSDQGTQYGCLAYRKLLEKVHAKQSMSARATPYDNAWTESFFGTLKREMLLSELSFTCSIRGKVPTTKITNYWSQFLLQLKGWFVEQILLVRSGISKQ